MTVVKTIIFLMSLVFFQFGCTSQGDIKIINRTEHNLYLSLQNKNYIISGTETLQTEIDIGNHFLFFGTQEKDIDIKLEGETFMMQEANNGVPTGEYRTETTIKVEADKTTKLYCDPTHAGVKLINFSNKDIISFQYFTNKSSDHISLIEDSLFPADSVWSRLQATVSADSIIYSFLIEDETGQIDSSYQDIDWLGIDEQLRIEWE